MNSRILEEDLSRLLKQKYIPFEKLKNKSFLITGSTGLIGKNVIHALVFLSKTLNLDINIYALARSRTKIEETFSSDVLSYNKIYFFLEDIENFHNTSLNYDYILHIASPTASKEFVDHAVEVIDFAYRTTKSLLELAKEKKATFVYFSSLEVYGTPTTDEKITEEYINNCPLTMSSRSSYSEGKRICETLCKSYFDEYGVPVFVLRLAQTFGPGVRLEDNRVFAQFARACMKEENIILNSAGETKRSYLYTMDMVSAVLTIILKGTAGDAYNIANEKTYCSIKEMAEMVCQKLSGNKSSLIFNIDKEKNSIYLPTNKTNLDCSKLRKLGWMPTTDLEEMFKRMIENWEQV